MPINRFNNNKKIPRIKIKTFQGNQFSKFCIIIDVFRILIEHENCCYLTHKFVFNQAISHKSFILDSVICTLNEQMLIFRCINFKSRKSYSIRISMAHTKQNKTTKNYTNTQSNRKISVDYITRFCDRNNICLVFLCLFLSSLYMNTN